jgi:TrpR-related protein YerC/YecD
MKKQKLVYPTSEMKELFDAVLEIKSKEEATNFFRDLLTIEELTEIANRWQTVKLLVAHKSYADIAKKVHVSSATVTRVAKWLKHGYGGYRTIANRSFDTSPNPDYHERPKLQGKLHGMNNPHSL